METEKGQVIQGRELSLFVRCGEGAMEKKVSTKCRLHYPHIYSGNLFQLTEPPIRLGELNVRQCRSAEQLINGGDGDQ